MLRTLKRAAAALTLATGILAGTVVSAQAADLQPGQQDSRGCRVGYVCMYQNDADYAAGRPSHQWFDYGAYNLDNQFGWKRIFNNQHSGAKVQMCYGYNGTNCTGEVVESWWVHQIDVTPINSVRLYA